MYLKSNKNYIVKGAQSVFICAQNSKCKGELILEMLLYLIRLLIINNLNFKEIPVINTRAKYLQKIQIFSWSNFVTKHA
jgi:hypothetical protein